MVELVRSNRTAFLRGAQGITHTPTVYINGYAYALDDAPLIAGYAVRFTWPSNTVVTSAVDSISIDWVVPWRFP